MGALEPAFWCFLTCVATARARSCISPDDICSQIKQLLGPKATPVCSSYLGPRETTVTATATTFPTDFTTTTLPPSTESTTVEETTTVFVTSQATDYSPDPIQTEVQTVTAPQSTTYAYNPPTKRDVLDPVLCSLLRKYPQAVVSAACSCVYNPSTATVTSTAIATDATTQELTSGPLTTIIETNTKVVSVTQGVTITTTLGPTTTDTIQSTTTFTPAPIVKPASCNKGGLPGPNASDYNYNSNLNTDQTTCITTCQVDPRCLSTGFYFVANPFTGMLTGTCRYYDKPVADTAALGPGYYSFNDKACPPPVP